MATYMETVTTNGVLFITSHPECNTGLGTLLRTHRGDDGDDDDDQMFSDVSNIYMLRNIQQ